MDLATGIWLDTLLKIYTIATMTKFSISRLMHFRLRKGYSVRLLLLVFACFSLAGVPLWGQVLDTQGLKSALDGLMDSSLVNGASVAVAFYAPEDSSLIYGYGAGKELMPASLQKLYTGIGALETYGPGHRFQTEIGIRGKVRDGVLEGDLVIKGGGDPTWMEAFYPEGPHRVFEMWADSLKARDIRRVRGNLVGDISLYPTYPYNPSWEAHNLPYGFSPGVGALSFNANMVRFVLKGSSQAGEKARAYPRHRYNYFELDNQITTVAEKGSAGIWLQVSEDNSRVTLKGKLGVDTPEYLTAAVRNPPLFTLRMLRNTLSEKGLSISGKTVLEEDPAIYDSLETLFVFDSFPLSDILGVMLKTSSNMIAENLLCNIGAGVENGAVRVEELLAAKGIPGEGFNVIDGSGLARQNSCSASHLGLTLSHAYHQDWFDIFLNSLALPGEDGTLRSRFTELKGKGRLYGKTGYLRDVSNLAGYLRAQDGELYAFVIICNDVSNVANAKKWQARVCDTLLRYSGD